MEIEFRIQTICEDNTLSNFSEIFIFHTKCDVGVEEPQNEISDVRIFPNPFSDELTIQYELTEKSDVEILLFNELGQEMERRVLMNQGSGDYSVDFRIPLLKKIKIYLRRCIARISRP